MATLLDSRQLTGADRRPAAVVARLQAGMTSRVHLHDPDAPLVVRLDAWELGGLTVTRAALTGALSLGHRRSRRGDDRPPVVSLYVQESGNARHEQADLLRRVTPGAFTAADLTVPYTFDWEGRHCTGRALHVPLSRLALPADVVRRAVPRLPASPLHDLVREHVTRVTRDAQRLSQDPQAAAVATATVELARALLASAAGADQPGPATDEVQLRNVRSWVLRHLADPELGPGTVAAAHTMSVRQLYRLCSAGGFSLEQWVIDQRLEGARRELADQRSRAIAAVARSWGFSDPSHFSRRFRARFGMSPREWRRVSAGARHPGPRAGADSPV
ncbi:helix-turn-helix domain-containing protein [Modestobacter sp. SYSU DS0875]